MLRNLLAATLFLVPTLAQAHFQELLPQTDILPEQGDRVVHLSLVFTHPVEGGPTMDMGPPVRFGVLEAGQQRDLRSALIPKQVDGKKAFEAAYPVKAPGDRVFFLEPAPYYELAEKTWLIHYTKVVVDFGSGEGWDKLVGLPVEIEPLTRPYGLWTGNLFRGLVRKDGKPLPFATVEVEWVNDKGLKVPSDPFTTQLVKTDGGGIFAYAIPHSGWWAFNAIAEGQSTTGPDGKPAKTELGGTIWVKAVDMP